MYQFSFLDPTRSSLSYNVMIANTKKIENSTSSLRQTTVLLLDCQTSGASPQSSHLLEIAWRMVSLDGDSIFSGSSASFIVKLPDGASLTKRISALTGITNEEMNRAEPAEVVANHLRSVINEVKSQGGFAVIHFARFEKVFLDRLWLEVFGEPEFELAVCCTHQLSKRLFPEFSGHGLRAVAGFFGRTMVDHKRAVSHLDATEAVWRGVVAALESREIFSQTQMHQLLSEKVSREKVNREYRISSEKRLALPTQPGIYKYLGKSGAVLYVGKATSLKSRVNSYFKRHRGGDPRKNEMLMQAWDLEHTVTETSLESAVLEFNLIQSLAPPYNMALRRKPVDFIFLNRDLETADVGTPSRWKYGPFDDRYGMRDFLALLEWLCLAQSTEAIPTHLHYLFFGLESPEILRQGFIEFLANFDVDTHHAFDRRYLLGIGLKLLQEKWTRVQADANAGVLFQKAPVEVEDEELEDSDNSIESEIEEHVWTTAEVAEKISRLLRRATLHWIEVLWLRRLNSCKIRFRKNSKTEWRVLHLQDGQIIENASNVYRKKVVNGWTPLGLASFRTVVQELRRVLARGGEVEVIPELGPKKLGANLSALLSIGF